jgi:hypothetical protein
MAASRTCSWIEGDGHDAFATVSSGELIRKEDISLLAD